MSGKPVKDHINLLENAELIKDLRRKSKGMAEVARECRHFCCFATFLFLFTFLTLNETFGEFYSFEESVRMQFDNVDQIGISDESLQLSEVQTYNDLWNYLNTTVYDNLFFDSYAPNATYEILKLKTHYNLVVGLARVRVMRTTPDIDCAVHAIYKSQYAECYGSYSIDTEAQDPYGLTDEGESFSYTAEEGEGMGQYSGTLATYSGGGYQKLLSRNHTRVSEELAIWREMGFFDAATRAVFVEFNVWNTNLGYYGSVKIVFEVSASGKFVNRFDFTVVTDRYIEFGFNSTMILDMILILFVAGYIAQELSEFMISKAEYFLDGWNIMDWANLILLIVVFVFRVLCFSARSESDVTATIADMSRFTDLTDYSWYITEIRSVNAFNAVLIWLKAVKYFGFIPYVTTMMHTIRYSWKFFISFFVIFTSIFIGFSIGFTGGFGDKFERVNSFEKSTLFLAQSFVGSADFGAMYALSPILAGLLIGLFIILVFFILLNLFMAIMVVALSEARAQEIQETESEYDKWKQKVEIMLTVLYDNLSLEYHIEYWLPGYFHRKKMKREAKEELAFRRQERKNALEMRRRVAMGRTALYDEGEDDGGPESPTAGRSKVTKAKRGTEDTEFGRKATATDLPLHMPLEAYDDFSDSEESEVDIGILSNSKVKMRKKKQQQQGASESELILQSVQHIASQLARRVDCVKTLLLDEMKDVKLICTVISDVLEILGRRGVDLSKQQQTFIESLGI